MRTFIFVFNEKQAYTLLQIFSGIKGKWGPKKQGKPRKKKTNRKSNFKDQMIDLEKNLLEEYVWDSIRNCELCKKKAIIISILLFKIKTSGIIFEVFQQEKVLVCSRFGEFSSDQYQWWTRFKCKLFPCLKYPFICK